MRDKLQPLRKQRHDFTARVGRRGSRRTPRGKRIFTIVLENVCIAGVKDIVAPHLWVDAGRWSKGIDKDVAVEISARVTWYEKGYYIEENRELDYTLKGIKLLRNYGKYWRGDNWMNHRRGKHGQLA